MTCQEVLKELESYGDPAIKKIYLNHGTREPFFGVRVGDMKKIVKKIKKDHELSLELYATGNTDAMYFAGLIADENQITKEQLELWISEAYYSGLSEYTVAWVAAESPHGWELALEWIESDREQTATSGWSILANWAGIRPDEELDKDSYSKLLDRVEKHIHDSPNRVRYTMNGFVIAVGSYIPDLTEKAQAVAEAIGKVHVDQGGTACKVPLATTYIKKVIDRGALGKKRKQARC